MESRGKRLVSMILNKPIIPIDVSDENPGSSNCSSVLSESKQKIVEDLERMFDSDDSMKDPNYNPDQDCLIQPEDLFELPRARCSEDEDLENCMRVYPEGDYNIDDTVHLVNVVTLPELKDPDAREIIISLWDHVLNIVFDSMHSRRRWMKPQTENWKKNIAKKRRSDGLPYTKGIKQRSAKTSKDIDCSKCFFKCSIISQEEREFLCRYYWHLNFIEQKNFILNNIIVDTPKRVLAIPGSKKQRQYTKKYYFTVNGEKNQCVKSFFVTPYQFLLVSLMMLFRSEIC